ncbi:polysaccharide deacetylase family protein [bacterium]|nr:polysaccharide deacetylase family protein [bacterium]
MKTYLFHKISDDYSDSWTVSNTFFREFIKKKVESGITFISESEVSKKHICNDENIALLHFDDGYTLNRKSYDYLIQLKIPFTVFIVAGLMGDWNRWDFSKELPVFSLMDVNEIKEMNSVENVTIASHTMSHTSLVTLEERRVFTELKRSKDVLENLLEQEVKYISYPYGDYNQISLENSKKAGYSRAYVVELRNSVKQGLELFGMVRDEIREN